MSLWERINRGFTNCEVYKNGIVTRYSVAEFLDPIDGAPYKKMYITWINPDNSEVYNHCEIYDNGLLDLVASILKCTEGSITIDGDIYTINICHVE